MKTLILFLFVTLGVFGGQSLQLTTQTISYPVPCPASGSWYIDASLHDWGTTTSASFPIRWCQGNNLLIMEVFSSSPGAINFFLSDQADNATPCVAFLTGISQVGGHYGINIRFYHQTNGTSGTDFCHVYDMSNGVLLNPSTQSAPFTGDAIGITPGFQLSGLASGGTLSHAYSALYSGAPLTSTPPVTHGTLTNNLGYFKFDLGNNTGSLLDSGPNNYTPTLSSGSPTFVATPFQTQPIATLTTLGAPSWTNWLSMRTGFPNSLDGSNSYSQADASSTVTCVFSQPSPGGDPSTLTFTNATSCGSPSVPSVTNVLFGTYNLLLTVTDAASNTATATLKLGAVCQDSNGIVCNSDPNVAKVFGPQIAFGKNPWSYEDERNCQAVMSQALGQNCLQQTLFTPNPYYSVAISSWAVPASGTVSYPFAGIGRAPGAPGGTLNTTITGSSTSIIIDNAQNITGLTNLPTVIYIGPNGVPFEAIRICTTSGTTGTVTVGVCLDGRGMAGASFIDNQPFVPAQGWTSGTIVGEMRLNGAGTLFSTDPVRPICPAGVPGPPGAVVSSSVGTVALTAGSTTATGSGSAFTLAMAGGYLRVPATISSVGFIFAGKIVSVNVSAQTMVLDRPAPTGIDAGPWGTYQITTPRLLSLGFLINAHQYNSLQQPAWCESDTVMFAVASFDLPPIDMVYQTGMNISYKESLGAASNFGPNFYGTGLAERAFYYRSGFVPALTAANQIDDYWPRDPEICGGYCVGSPLYTGGGALGGIANVALNSATLLSWLDVTPFAATGVLGAPQNCNYQDPRDQGYPQAALALTALLDPDPTRHATWISGLSAWITKDQTCRRNASDGYTGIQTNSWAGASVFSPSVFPPIALTNGSTIATGTALPSSMCAGQDDGTGTITVTTGSTTATVVSGTVNAGDRLSIVDTTSSPIFVSGFEFSGTGGPGSTITLAGLWSGASGTFHFMSESDALQGFTATIGIDNSDWPTVSIAAGLASNTQLQKFWACQWNSSTQITLNRPWDGTSGTYSYDTYILMGFEVQPFMVGGIKTAAMSWAAQSTNSTVASAYTTMAAQSGQWTASYGVDLNSPGTLGMYYGRVLGACEPPGVPNPVTLFFTIRGTSSNQTPCGSSGLAAAGGGAGEFTDRVSTAEGGSALVAYYNAQCALGHSQCVAATTFVSKYYGAIYGNPAMTTSGFYNDSHYVNAGSELSDVSLEFFKWPGFFFGVGRFGSSFPAMAVCTLNGGSMVGFACVPGGTISGAVHGAGVSGSGVSK